MSVSLQNKSAEALSKWSSDAAAMLTVASRSIGKQPTPAPRSRCAPDELPGLVCASNCANERRNGDKLKTNLRTKRLPIGNLTHQPCVTDESWPAHRRLHGPQSYGGKNVSAPRRLGGLRPGCAAQPGRVLAVFWLPAALGLRIFHTSSATARSPSGYTGPGSVAIGKHQACQLLASPTRVLGPGLPSSVTIPNCVITSGLCLRWLHQPGQRDHPRQRDLHRGGVFQAASLASATIPDGVTSIWGFCVLGLRTSLASLPSPTA